MSVSDWSSSRSAILRNGDVLLILRWCGQLMISVCSLCVGSGVTHCGEPPEVHCAGQDPGAAWYPISCSCFSGIWRSFLWSLMVTSTCPTVQHMFCCLAWPHIPCPSGRGDPVASPAIIRSREHGSVGNHYFWFIVPDIRTSNTGHARSKSITLHISGYWWWFTTITLSVWGLHVQVPQSAGGKGPELLPADEFSASALTLDDPGGLCSPCKNTSIDQRERVQSSGRFYPYQRKIPLHDIISVLQRSRQYRRFTMATSCLRVWWTTCGQFLNSWSRCPFQGCGIWLQTKAAPRKVCTLSNFPNKLPLNV